MECMRCGEVVNSSKPGRWDYVVDGNCHGESVDTKALDDLFAQLGRVDGTLLGFHRQSRL